MSINPTGHALDRMPRRKRSRQHVIIGVSARQLRRAEAAEARKAARKAAKAAAITDAYPILST